MPENLTSKRLYAIEFLRIFFIFFIIIGHIMQSCPSLKDDIYSFFDVKLMPTWFCVEFYSLIGGFLVYKKAIANHNVFDRVVHVYNRLLPSVLFFFSLGCILKITKLVNLPYVLSMTQGLSLGIGDAIGWGDWFVGAYFWSITFVTALLIYYKNKAFIVILPLCYILFCMRYNYPYPGWMTAYGFSIGTEFSRVLSCVMLGTLGGFLAENINIPNSQKLKYILSILEGYCLFWCFYHIFTDRMSPISVVVCFTILLILISKSFGIISNFLNQKVFIQTVSKYSFNIYLGAGFMQTLVLEKIGITNNLQFISVILLGG